MKDFENEKEVKRGERYDRKVRRKSEQTRKSKEKKLRKKLWKKG